MSSFASPLASPIPSTFPHRRSRTFSRTSSATSRASLDRDRERDPLSPTSPTSGKQRRTRTLSGQQGYARRSRISISSVPEGGITGGRDRVWDEEDQLWRRKSIDGSGAVWDRGEGTSTKPSIATAPEAPLAGIWQEDPEQGMQESGAGRDEGETGADGYFDYRPRASSEVGHKDKGTGDAVFSKLDSGRSQLPSLNTGSKADRGGGLRRPSMDGHFAKDKEDNLDLEQGGEGDEEGEEGEDENDEDIREEVKESWFGLKKAGAGIIFVVVLLSYTTQTELAQTVQKTYKKPYFLLYLTHCSYLFLFPFHLLVLHLLNVPIPRTLRTIRSLLHHQFTPANSPKKHHYVNIGDDSDGGGRLRMEDGASSSLLSPSFAGGGGEDGGRSSHSKCRSDVEGLRGSLSLKKSSSSLQLLISQATGEERSAWVGFPWLRLGLTILGFTLLIAIPAGSWYAAIPLTSMTDITALYNVNCFWAFVFAALLMKEEDPPTKGQFVAVVIAIVGVVVIAYGDSKEENNDNGSGGTIGLPGEGETGDGDEKKGTGSRLIGNMLALVGSITYGLYEVLYAKYGALPEKLLEEETVQYDKLPDMDEEDQNHFPSALRQPRASFAHDDDYDNDMERGHPERGPVSALSRRSVHFADDEISSPHPYRSPSPLSTPSHREGSAPSPSEASMLFLLHADLMTSLIGVFTVFILWVPIPILNWLGKETFELPDLKTGGLIVGVVSCGVLFNGGIMILLGLWGPVVVSVGNLCTLVLVAIADTVLPWSSGKISLASVIGCLLIVGAFSILLYGLVTSGREEEKEEAMKERVGGRNGVRDAESV